MAGIVAARPREPSLNATRAWLATLREAVDSEQRGLIVSVLKDAIPEFATGEGPVNRAATAKIEQARP
jgi:hypothetical protein